MTIDCEDDLDSLKHIGAIVRETLAAMMSACRAGISSRELDELGGRLLEEAGAQSAPKLAYNFPGFTCISVGDVVAHGIPNETPIAEGTMVNIDVSAEKNGYFADSGASFVVGKATPDQQSLLSATQEAQRQGMLAARHGLPINTIGQRVERVARRAGLKVVDGLNGHGVGRGIHEPPTVSNRYHRSDRKRLWSGLVLTVEPFLTRGFPKVREGSDGWSLRLLDDAPAAQFEHSFVVTKGAPIVLT